MNIDVTGRIQNTRLAHQHALLPVFEAVINSMHAIQDLGKIGGKIVIRIERDQSQPTQQHLDGSVLFPIKSFSVEDNGIGFTDGNYESFSIADSRRKADVGGKGVGRFLWLKAFDWAEIDSRFEDDNGQWKHRHFEFRLTPAGVENQLLEPATQEKRSTVVQLRNLKPEFQKHVQRSAKAVANRIVEHCLEHFVLGLAPEMILVDMEAGEQIDLGELYRSEVRAQTQSTSLHVAGHNFNMHNLRVGLTYDNAHRLYFCANKRAVVSEKLEGRVANLVSSLRDDEGKAFFYAGYISGDYLDEMVNTERTGFSLPAEDSILGELSWRKLVDQAATSASEFLEPYTRVVKQSKEERIRNFVQNQAPHYRPLLKHKTAVLDAIPPNLSDTKLDLELYRLNQDYDAELREVGVKLLGDIEKGDVQQVKDVYSQFLEEWNEAGMAKLASHVAHRKATLSLLRASLNLTDKGKYQLENAVHGLIFPLKKTSDDVRADQMNLWIIDEKLAYHYYLASDIPFNQLRSDTISLESSDRPDVLIFNRPAAFVNQGAPFSSVVLIEFKRPGRDDYSDDENPITQIYKYVGQIKAGKAVDRGGRPISVPVQMPFYTYIIADITDTLRFQAQTANLHSSPDGLGYFGYNNQIGVYLEIISFDKLVSDAERRNAYFFHQLGLL